MDAKTKLAQKRTDLAATCRKTGRRIQSAPDAQRIAQPVLFVKTGPSRARSRRIDGQTTDPRIASQ